MIVPLIDILIGTDAVTDLCAADNILPMHRTQAIPLPAIVLERAGANPNDTKSTTSEMDEDRVTVSCYHTSYSSAHALAEQVRLAIDGFRGTQSGYEVESVRYNGSSDGYMDDNEKVFRVTQEYNVMIKRDGLVVADQNAPANPYMLKSVYDSNGNGIVDNAAKVNGVDAAGNSKYYGTDDTGIPGFYALPDASGLADGNYGAFTVTGGVAQLNDEVVDTDQYAHNSISNDKLYHVAQYTFKGRLSAGAGDPEDLTANQALSGLDTATDPYLRTSKRAANNGVASLDAGGKVPIAQIPDAVIGQVEYQGTWNAATNTPAIPVPSTSNKGWYYLANAGVSSAHGYANVPAVDFEIGDWIISDGTAWSKVDNTDAVLLVNGQKGNVVLVTADITDSLNRRYVTDAQLVVVGNTSGTNTGDNATNSQYSGLAVSKQDTLVSAANIKTINGNSVLGSGNLTISAGITAVEAIGYSLIFG